MDNNKRAFLNAVQFDDIWQKLGLSEDALRKLQNEIIRNPNAGRLIRGTGGFRKRRFALEGEGKSGGFRIIYMDMPAYSFVYLLMVYPKTVKETLTDAEKAVLRRISKETLEAFRKREVKW